MEADLVRDLSDATGSMMDVPKSLLAEIKSLEEQLTVNTDKLKAVTDHFMKELEKGKSMPRPGSYGRFSANEFGTGLSVEGGSIVSFTLGLSRCGLHDEGN